MSLIDIIMAIFVFILIAYFIGNFQEVNYIPCSTVNYYPIGLTGISYFILPILGIFTTSIAIVIFGNGVKGIIIEKEMKK